MSTELWEVSSDLSTALCYFSWIYIAAVYIVLVALVSRQRKRTFTPIYMERYAEHHENFYGGHIPKGGYPEMGSGIYSSDLDYESWYLFNCAQHCHMNMVESLVIIAPVGVLLMIYGSSLGATLVNLVYGTGQLLYGVCYSQNQTMRIAGEGIHWIAMILSFCCLIWTAISNYPSGSSSTSDLGELSAGLA